MSAPVRKSLGQHFLVDAAHSRDIVETLGAQPGAVIEIGPGRGALTAGLAARATTLLCIEKDRALAAQLQDTFAAHEHVTVVCADALDYATDNFPSGAHLIGNLPYNVATNMLLRWMPLGTQLTQMVVMVQREVADRLLAPAADPARGRLSVIAQLLMEPQRLFDVPPGSFQPPPAVHSTVLRLTPRPQVAVAEAERDAFTQLVRSAFANRRKTLRNNLPAWSAADFARCEIDPARRAQTLSVAEFVRLHEVAVTL